MFTVTYQYGNSPIVRKASQRTTEAVLFIMNGYEGTVRMEHRIEPNVTQHVVYTVTSDANKNADNPST